MISAAFTVICRLSNKSDAKIKPLCGKKMYQLSENLDNQNIRIKAFVPYGMEARLIPHIWGTYNRSLNLCKEYLIEDLDCSGEFLFIDCGAHLLEILPSLVAKVHKEKGKMTYLAIEPDPLLKQSALMTKTYYENLSNNISILFANSLLGESDTDINFVQKPETGDSTRYVLSNCDPIRKKQLRLDNLLATLQLDQIRFSKRYIKVEA